MGDVVHYWRPLIIETSITVWASATMKLVNTLLVHKVVGLLSQAQYRKAGCPSSI